MELEAIQLQVNLLVEGRRLVIAMATVKVSVLPPVHPLVLDHAQTIAEGVPRVVPDVVAVVVLHVCIIALVVVVGARLAALYQDNPFNHN